MTANTLDELAAGMDVPAETLKATFARYDELVAAGEDTDFEKKAWLNSLEPPYHALRLNVCRYKTSGGFMVGPNNQVLDKEDKEIPGLYAAGAVTTLSYASVSTRMATGYYVGETLGCAVSLEDADLVRARRHPARTATSKAGVGTYPAPVFFVARIALLASSEASVQGIALNDKGRCFSLAAVLRQIWKGPGWRNSLLWTVPAAFWCGRSRHRTGKADDCGFQMVKAMAVAPGWQG